MKQFIVMAAVLPIMLVFVAQFSLEAVRSLRMNAAEDAIRAFCIEASYFDGGGPAEAEALRYKLAQIFRADPREVYIELSQIDMFHITWRVSFPVGEIMAGARLMGLSSAENRGRVNLSGEIVIAPPPPEPLPPPVPVDPELLLDTVEPVDPELPVDPIEPVEPTEPTDPAPSDSETEPTGSS